MICILIGINFKLATYSYIATGSLCTRFEYKLVNANRVCLGIHKVKGDLLP